MFHPLAQDALRDQTVQLFLRTAQHRSLRADARSRLSKSKRRVAVQSLREAVEGLRVAARYPRTACVGWDNTVASK